MNWHPLFLRVFYFFEYAVIFYVAAINAVYLFLMLAGYFALRATRLRLSAQERMALMKSPLVPPIAVLAPAYNEALTIRESVHAMLRLHYPNHEVIVINDGSTDDTLKILTEEFHLYRSGRSAAGVLPSRTIRAVYASRDPIRLVVVDKENGGKSDSLNAGINLARAPLVAVVDSDSLLEPTGLLQAVKPFLDDRRTLATGGIVRVVNGCEVRHGQVLRIRAPEKWLPMFQVVEYLRAFLGGRVAFSLFNTLLLISGAFGLFRRDAVIEVGGFDTKTVGEDMELVLRLHRRWREKKEDYRIVFVPEPVCWTEVPEDLKILQRQRNRWQRGTVESVKRHAAMLFRPKYGVIGVFGLPYFMLFEMFGPVVELLGYALTIIGLLLGLIVPQVALLFFIVAVLFGIVLSTGSVLLEEFTTRRYPGSRDLLRLFLAGLIENLGYRQLLTAWRAKGVFDALRRKKGWGKMKRRGFARPATDSRNAGIGK